mmetsp:Transcript_12588/g.18346  ORF Transcript_12588/g.18346 Transcript_12588/m.18346 type:complete len:104 (+) Transcript_12588:40-351(+)
MTLGEHLRRTDSTEETIADGILLGEYTLLLVFLVVSFSKSRKQFKVVPKEFLVFYFFSAINCLLRVALFAGGLLSCEDSVYAVLLFTGILPFLAIITVIIIAW